MDDTDLDPLIRDPHLVTSDAARTLIALASAITNDPDLAADVVLNLTEQLRGSRRLAEDLADHPNPYAFIQMAAKHAALDAIKAANRNKRFLPLTGSGDLSDVAGEVHISVHPTSGLFDLLEDLGWNRDHLTVLATPRRRSGRSIHPGIDDAIERLARCYGVTDRCQGCPSPMELQRLDLRGPLEWMAVVEVALDWGWSDELIEYLTTSPTNVASWVRSCPPPPPKQGRRVIEVARYMRWDPWVLATPDAVRAACEQGGPGSPARPAVTRPQQLAYCGTAVRARQAALVASRAGG